MEDSFRGKSEEDIEKVALDVRRAWFSNPCTQAILSGLRADVLFEINKWCVGADTYDKIDANTLKGVEARAKVQMIENFIERLEEVKLENDSEKNETSRA